MGDESQKPGEPEIPEKPDESAIPQASESPEEVENPGESAASEKPDQSASPSEPGVIPITGNKCTGEDFRPDTKDCNKFYRCANNIEYQFSCPNGTVWDPSINSCNYPWGVYGQCGTATESTKPTELESASTPDSSEVTSKQTTTEGLQPSPTTEAPGNPEQTETPETLASVKPDTSNKCGSEEFRGDPSNCSKFYRCANGIEYQFSCPQETVWDSTKNSCNYPWAVIGNCSTTPTTTSNIQTTGLTVSTTESISSSSTSETATSLSTETTTTGDVSTTISQAEKKCVDGDFRPDEIDCTKFHRCANGIDYVFTCSEGTVWDQPSKSCNYPWAVYGKCGTSKEPPTTQSSDSSEISTQSNTTEPAFSEKCNKAGSYPDANDCAKFYKCDLLNENSNQEYAVSYYTCAEGEIFDPGLSKCNDKESVVPKRNCTPASSTDSFVTEVNSITS